MTTTDLRLVSTSNPETAPAIPSYLDKRRATLAVACPHCHAAPGRQCTTPNGWGTTHKARIRAGQGEAPKPPRKPGRRLSEAQAERIERAAEAGRYYAPGRYAYLRGDAAERACADALERRGLIRQTDTHPDGERVFVLTVEGWEAYHTDPKVIRRLPDDQHAAACPCRTDSQEG